MSEWIIKPSYKLDLACFCNLFYKADMVIDKHREAYEIFKDRIDRRNDLVEFSKGMLAEGYMIGVAMASLLDLIDYNGGDIDEICSIMDDESTRPILDEFITKSGYTEELREKVLALLPIMSDMLHYVHSMGFFEYWHDECIGHIKNKCDEFTLLADRYPVVSTVNDILGIHGDRKPPVTLYVCRFSAPYGIGLTNAFISDVRWNFEDTVAIALHELIHPPFKRGTIREMADGIWKDDFFRKAKGLLEASSGYGKPEDFLEENLVEGTHIYLSEEMGVEKNPLKYLAEHDSGSHVISAILYDALKKGYGDKAGSIEEVVWKLIEEGPLKPGKIEENYLRIYNEAGLLGLCPKPLTEGDKQ